MTPRKKHQLGFSLVVLAIVAWSPTSRGDVVAIAPSQDGSLFQEPNGALANGAGEFLFVGRTAQSGSLSRRRAMLKFDLSGSIPPNSIVSSATLTLFMSRTATATTTVTVHRLLDDWGEGASDAPLQEGTGAPSQPNDATWLHRFYDADFWSVPGGDYAPTASATRTIVGIGSYTWDSTEGLVSDVQSWVDDPANNNGWIVIGPEFAGTTAKRFNSREHPTLDTRPVLTVEFTPGAVPTTSTWGFLILALSLLAVARIVFSRQDRQTT